MVFSTPSVPGFRGLTLTVKFTAPVITTTPTFRGASIVVKSTGGLPASIPAYLGSTLVIKGTVPSYTTTPSFKGLTLVVQHDGAASPPRALSGNTPVFHGLTFVCSQTTPLYYDDINRMTDESYRDQDYTRFDDQRQILRNQAFVYARFGEDHNVSDGSHKTQYLSAMAGYQESSLDLPLAPIGVDFPVFVAVSGGGDAESDVFFARVSPSPASPAAYEAVPAYGFSDGWTSYLLVAIGIPDPE